MTALAPKADTPEADYAALEREHFGDPDKGTGIYHEAPSHSAPSEPSFAEAWKAKGYQYSDSNVEKVRLGWDMHVAAMRATLPEVKAKTANATETEKCTKVTTGCDCDRVCKFAPPSTLFKNVRVLSAAEREPIPEVKAEPVAQVSEVDGKKCVTFYSYKALYETPLWTKLYAAPEVKAEPVMWQWRVFDATNEPHHWTEWEQVVPRNHYMGTVADRVAEFRAYIAQGNRYELRPLYAAPIAPEVKADSTERAALIAESYGAQLGDEIARAIRADSTEAPKDAAARGGKA